MKTFKAFLILGAVFLSFFANAQTPIDAAKVPAEVMREFQKRFPQVTASSWAKLGEDYYASFEQNNTKTTYIMAFSGRWLRTESETSFDELPRVAQKYVTTNYSESKREKILFVQTKEKSEYDVFLENAGKKIMLAFDNSGNLVSKPVENNAQNGNVPNLGNTDNKTGNSKQPLNVKELPSNITSDILAVYPQYTISEAYFINDETYSNTYYLICKTESQDKSVELWYDFSGKKIKSSDDASSGSENKGKKDKAAKGDKADKGKKGKNVRRPVPESSVPVAAVESFKKKEPKAENVRWDTIGKYYVASYYNPAKSIDSKMYFTQAGVWDYTSVAQSSGDLNPMISKYLDENYSKFEVESVESIVKADKKKFVLIKVYDPAWINNPMVFTELYFNTSGKLEKEIIADGIDGYYLDEQKRKDEDDAYFNEYLDSDDNNLKEGEMVDGQIVTRKELPTQANNYIVKNYKGYRFLECIIVNDEGKMMYSVFIKKEQYPEKVRLLFDVKGNFISAEQL